MLPSLRLLYLCIPLLCLLGSLESLCASTGLASCNQNPPGPHLIFHVVRDAGASISTVVAARTVYLPVSSATTSVHGLSDGPLLDPTVCTEAQLVSSQTPHA
ncbi:hypothetical protein DFH06DRAFT_1169687 [Mycena polygramma]|nr:hypothetical protein DFH06DRAFT_1169687 [Mycena polygramma]